MLTTLFESSHQSKGDTANIPYIEMRKLRHREINSRVYTMCKQESFMLVNVL